MRGSNLLWGAGVAAVLAVGVANWRASTSVDPDAAGRGAAGVPSAAPVDAASLPPRQPAVAAAAPATLPAAPPTALPSLPPGISADRWDALRAEFADRPAELQRLAAHFAFAGQVDRFRSGSASGTERLALARAIDAGLDERLRERELGAGEARLIKIAVLDVLQPDEAQRNAALARWEAAFAPPAPDVKRAAAEAGFQRQQAQIVAAWRALPAGTRDPRALEAELQALREKSFVPPQAEGAQR